MEEWVGALWHRAITRAADRSHPEAAVTLAEVQPLLGVLFRAAGGDASTRLAPAGETRVAGGRGARGWLQRIAGTGQRAALPWWGPEVLALPPELALFDDRSLNRDLYLWLAAQAACYAPTGHWLADNQAATAAALRVFPGLAVRHQRLVAAHLAQRPPASSSPAEAAVQAALRGEARADEGARAGAGPANGVLPQVVLAQVVPADVAPVWLWLDGQATHAAEAPRPSAEPGDGAPRADTPQDATRRRARQVAEEKGRAPFMLPFRAEALFSWSELIKVDRATDDDENPDALAAARDLDHLSLARNGQASASRVKFDLDLPSAAADDLPLGPGQPLPEWDFKRGLLRPAHCTAQLRVALPGQPFVPTPALRATARRVRRRIEGLRAAPQWVRGQAEGEAIDLDAWVRHASAGRGPAMSCRGAALDAALDAAPPVYAQRQRQARSLATLLLADLSLSTDAYVPGTDAQGRAQRVIDVVRDALYVFGEALAGTGDAFEMLGFSSVRRQNVRIQHLKGFDEAWGPAARERVGAIRPGYYTRMGAAIRLATQRLQARPERQRLLLLLTDGKPNDLDVYEGRYGLEDTRHAVQAARAAGLTPFAVTIDGEAHDYLPHLFGQRGWALVRRPADLVGRLAQLHAQLAR